MSDSSKPYESTVQHLRNFMLASPVHCPAPSGGTAGQVCAVNTGTNAYELVDQTGGGTGTDDQTAAEVTVDATAFSGNLSTADTAVQTALDTIDGLTLGGGGTVSVVAFSAPLANVAAATYGTATQILDLGTATINQGAFTVDDTGTADRIMIPEDGIYELIASIHVTGVNRSIVSVRFTLDNGTDAEVAIAGQGAGYVRGLDTELFIVAEHAHLADLNAGDLIGVTIQDSKTAENIVVVGASSSIDIIKIGGAKGDVGGVGPAGSGDDAATWAEAGNTDTIPTAKYGTTTIPGTALENASVGNGQLVDNIDGAQITTETLGHGKLHSETGGADEDEHASWRLTGWALSIG